MNMKNTTITTTTNIDNNGKISSSTNRRRKQSTSITTRQHLTMSALVFIELGNAKITSPIVYIIQWKRRHYSFDIDNYIESDWITASVIS